MSKIKKGDLVMVVRKQPCCGSALGIGTTYPVVGVVNERGWPCANCGSYAREPIILDTPEGGYALSRLIKIDPPPVAEDVPAVEELTA